MFDVISIGSSLVDIFIHSPQFKVKDIADGKSFTVEGDKVDMERMEVFSGGGGTNTAVGFSRLGFKAGLLSETGKDNFAHIITSELRKEGVDPGLLITERYEETGGSVMLVAKDGSRTALIYRGASSMLDPHDIPAFHLSQARWVHLSNIAGRADTLSRIFELVKKSEQTTLSWNPGKQALKLIAQGKIKVSAIPCKVLILNLVEWEMVKKQQAELIKEIPEIVVTNGKEGGFVYEHGKQSLKFMSSGHQAVEATGAGDAFCTGYVAGQLMNHPVRVCVEWGVRNAGSVVSQYGAKQGLLKRNQIKAPVKQ